MREKHQAGADRQVECVGLTQRCLLGWEAAAAGAPRLRVDGDYAARKDPDKVCSAPVDHSPLFSYFSIFQRMHHFLNPHDPEAKLAGHPHPQL